MKTLFFCVAMALAAPPAPDAGKPVDTPKDDSWRAAFCNDPQHPENKQAEACKEAPAEPSYDKALFSEFIEMYIKQRERSRAGRCMDAPGASIGERREAKANERFCARVREMFDQVRAETSAKCAGIPSEALGACRQEALASQRQAVQGKRYAGFITGGGKVQGSAFKGKGSKGGGGKKGK